VRDTRSVASVAIRSDWSTDESGVRLDILVNNAVQRTHEKRSDFTTEKIEATFRTDIQRLFHLAKAAAKHRQPGAPIINMASIQADMPSPSLLAYAITKGAMATFTAGLAQSVSDAEIW
jgi:short-subunit dehydrogenase